MLRFLRLPVTIFTTIISFSPLLPAVGNAQYFPICFMVISSGQVVDLSKLCQSKTQSQSPQKAEACQGPFDSDGFPIALSSELELLKAAVAEAKKGNDYAVSALKIEFSIAALLEQMPFSKRSRYLLQEEKLLLKQLQAVVNSEEAQYLKKKLTTIKDKLSEELSQNPCFLQLMQSLGKKLEN